MSVPSLVGVLVPVGWLVLLASGVLPKAFSSKDHARKHVIVFDLDPLTGTTRLLYHHNGYRKDKWTTTFSALPSTRAQTITIYQRPFELVDGFLRPVQDLVQKPFLGDPEDSYMSRMEAACGNPFDTANTWTERMFSSSSADFLGECVPEESESIMLSIVDRSDPYRMSYFTWNVKEVAGEDYEVSEPEPFQKMIAFLVVKFVAASRRGSITVRKG
ncbi:hypothetical protein C8R46DRAFT_1076294, partial [Mycena filopes]